MNFFKFLDAYTLRARLFPAIIAAAPALAAIAFIFSWDKIALSNTIATLGLLVLIFALADFARKQGLRIEPTIYAEMGGKPSITMMRHEGDDTIDEYTKNRYRTFLAGKIGRPAPSANDEAQNRADADTFYEQCGIWLRDSTRDAKKFPILFGELVTYGFRRNLRGLKWWALILNLLVVVICAGLLWYGLDIDKSHVGLVFVVASIHAIYIAFAVTKAGVKEAARKYGRELILSCETLMRGGAQGGRKSAAGATA